MKLLYCCCFDIIRPPYVLTFVFFFLVSSPTYRLIGISRCLSQILSIFNMSDSCYSCFFNSIILVFSIFFLLRYFLTFTSIEKRSIYFILVLSLLQLLVLLTVNSFRRDEIVVFYYDNMYIQL